MAENNDHDLLIGLNVKMSDMQVDVKEIKEGTYIRLNQHETWIKALQVEMESHKIVKKIVFGAVGVFLISLVGALATLIIRH